MSPSLSLSLSPSNQPFPPFPSSLPVSLPPLYDRLLAHGIRYDSVSMNELNVSYNISNPTADKVSYYFRSKLQWEKDKDRILAAMVRENPLLKDIMNRN